MINLRDQTKSAAPLHGAYEGHDSAHVSGSGEGSSIGVEVESVSSLVQVDGERVGSSHPITTHQVTTSSGSHSCVGYPCRDGAKTSTSSTVVAKPLTVSMPLPKTMRIVFGQCAVIGDLCPSNIAATESDKPWLMVSLLATPPTTPTKVTVSAPVPAVMTSLPEVLVMASTPAPPVTVSAAVPVVMMLPSVPPLTVAAAVNAEMLMVSFRHHSRRDPCQTLTCGDSDVVVASTTVDGVVGECVGSSCGQSSNSDGVSGITTVHHRGGVSTSTQGQGVGAKVTRNGAARSCGGVNGVVALTAVDGRRISGATVAVSLPLLPLAVLGRWFRSGGIVTLSTRTVLVKKFALAAAV